MSPYRRFGGYYVVAATIITALVAVFVAWLLSAQARCFPIQLIASVPVISMNVVKNISLHFPLRQFLSSSTKGFAPVVSSPLQSHQSTSISNNRPFSSTASAMSAKNNFWDVIKERRTYYQLNKEAPVSDERIEQLVRETILNVPSSFNSQSARLVVLLRKDHDTFWDLVKDALKPLVPAAQFETTEKKLNGFKAAYGTILFFEDPAPVQALQTNFPLYADKFPQWSEHTSAMHQLVLWAGLESEGFGANLQHYNPVVDAAAQAQWNIPAAWSLKAQLVFGGRAGEPGPKTFLPLEERLVVHGAEGAFKN